MQHLSNIVIEDKKQPSIPLIDVTNNQFQSSIESPNFTVPQDGLSLPLLPELDYDESNQVDDTSSSDHHSSRRLCQDDLSVGTKLETPSVLRCNDIIPSGPFTKTSFEMLEQESKEHARSPETQTRFRVRVPVVSDPKTDLSNHIVGTSPVIAQDEKAACPSKINLDHEITPARFSEPSDTCNPSQSQFADSIVSTAICHFPVVDTSFIRSSVFIRTTGPTLAAAFLSFPHQNRSFSPASDARYYFLNTFSA